MLFARLISKLTAQNNAIRFLASRILVHTNICRLFTIQQNGFRLHFHPAAVPMTLWVNPHAWDEDLHFIQAILREGDTYVDVGANIGQLVIQAALCIQNPANIMAIEAHPTTYHYLCENLALNTMNSIKACHCAVGAHEGTVKFTSKRSDDQNEISSSGDIEVTMKPLDALISFSEVTLLKIDVEGFELFVFQGAEKILSHTQAIYFEAWDTHFAKHNYSFTDIAALLTRQGFSFYTVNGKHLTPYTQTTAPDFTNLLALKSIDWANSRGFTLITSH